MLSKEQLMSRVTDQFRNKGVFLLGEEDDSRETNMNPMVGDYTVWGDGEMEPLEPKEIIFGLWLFGLFGLVVAALFYGSK